MSLWPEGCAAPPKYPRNPVPRLSTRSTSGLTSPSILLVNLKTGQVIVDRLTEYLHTGVDKVVKTDAEGENGS